ncbi:MAG: metallophosphoesterase [Thermoguttaceae bacterium]
MNVLLLFLALVGHGVLWVALINRIHAQGWPRRLINVLTVACFAALFLIPLAFGAWLLLRGASVPTTLELAALKRPGVLAAFLYAMACWLGAGMVIHDWVWRHVLHRPPAVLRFHRSRKVALSPPRPDHEDHAHHPLVRMPGNESLRLELTERAVSMSRLPPALDGLAIVHISDFHFSGRVGKAYFQEIVRASNELEPDLVAVTGDLVDSSRCIDWIPDTLGRLRGRHGVYFILGNHDVGHHIDTPRLLKVCQESGMVYLGGRWLKLTLRGREVLLAGNELPWLPTAADMRDCPPRDGGPLRIIFSHSPDQLQWARANDADLMLAGHTHGGQIRLPLIGPIFSPSRMGVRYASGLFHAPPTILHVSRGVSGKLPVRMNCPPEMTHLVLHVAGGPH